MKTWAFAVSPYGLGLTGDQFWDLIPCEFDALREVWDQPRDDEWYRWAALMAKIHNAWCRGENSPAVSAEDFYESRRRKKRPVSKVQLADPLDPKGTQTVEQKIFAMRSMLADAAACLPNDAPRGLSVRGEMPESQRRVVEDLWASYDAITHGKPN